jgi:hypothetical protein
VATVDGKTTETAIMAMTILTIGLLPMKRQSAKSQGIPQVLNSFEAVSRLASMPSKDSFFTVRSRNLHGHTARQTTRVPPYSGF